MRPGARRPRRTLEIGRPDQLTERDGWLGARFRLRDDPLGKTAEEHIKIGTPVSIGAKIHRLGKSTDVALLEEISLVPRAAYPGAKIIDRATVLWSPPPTWPIEHKTTETPKPSPRAISDPGGGEVFYGGPVIRREGIGRVLGLR